LPVLRRAIPATPRAWMDNAAILALFTLALLQVAGGTYSPFLYFRF
jgi:hypothetical protein